MTDVELHLQTEQGGTASPLANAWVYLRAGGSVTRLRTDEHGHAFSLDADGNADTAADYGQRHLVRTGDTLEICHCAAALALPDEALDRHPTVFLSRTVPTPTTAPSQGTVPIGPDNTNTLAPRTAAVVSVPPTGATIDGPAALSLWPVLWSLADAAYHTDGLAQGDALFASGALTVTENGPAPAPADAVRPTVRALRVSGTLTGTVTRVRVSLHDSGGAALALRANGSATTDVQEVDATIAGTAFSANLLLAAPQDAFGDVHLDVIAEDGSGSALATASGLLVGVQTSLVNDRASNVDGQHAGPVRGEADEVIIVDFLDSPQSGDLDQITAQTRARRMIADDIATRDRPLSAAITTVVEQPEMPLWMIELHLLGLTEARLDSLLQRREAASVGTAGEIRVSAQWSLAFSWDGPNAAHTTRPYTLAQTFPAATPPPTHTVRFARGTDGSLSTTQAPVPAAPAFPVAGRRAATVQLDTPRAWGRAAGATSVDGTVIEFQPLITNGGGDEIMRGGDVVLAFHSLQFDGVAVHPGLDAGATTFTEAPTDPIVRPPTLRVRGVNPVGTDVPGMVDLVVQEFFDAHSTDDHVAMLTLAQWQVTVRNIVRVESIGSHQFDHRPAGRRRFAGRRYGHEHDMPIFGAPAGYGLGQLDSPPVTDDQAWSFIDNIRGSVRLIMRDKARAAHRFMRANLPAAPANVDRAAFRREVVRRYNGGTEVRFRAGTWELFPTAPNSRINYPNHVLSTTVAYAGTRTAVPFPAAQFGPGI